MSGTLPTWLRDWLDVKAAESSEAVVWGLDHAWPWAAWFTLLLVVLIGACVIGAYATEAGSAGRRMRALLAALRLAAIAVLLTMIAQWTLTLTRTGLPLVVVMIDDSASMGAADPSDADDAHRVAVAQRMRALGLESPTRLNLAKTLLLENHAGLLEQLAKRSKCKVYFVSETARIQPDHSTELAQALQRAEPTGTASRLGDGVRTVLADWRGTPPAAIILLSDGITTAGDSLADSAALARRKGVPIFTVALGSETPIRDIELTDLAVDDVVFLNDIVNFDFKLSATGLENRTVNVVLKEKGGNQPLATQQVKLGPDGQVQRLRLTHQPTKTGAFEFAIEAQTIGDESRTDNNRETRLVTVREEKFRVLMVQAYPNFEFRYLKEMLKRDATIQLRYVLQEADVDFVELDPRGQPITLANFPLKREELLEYDVVIFGDVNPALLSAADQRNLAAFVTEKGGGIIFIAGPQFTPVRYAGSPLAPLIPFAASQTIIPDPRTSIDEGFVVRPTELGLASPSMQLGDTPMETTQIWRKLPPVYFLAEAAALKPTARVLAEHPTRTGPDGKPLPVIVQQYIGAGRVLFHLTDDTWRWRYQVGDVFFARYWVQTIRALSRAKLVGKDRGARLSTDRNRFERGQSVRLQLRFLDERSAPADDDGVTVMLERNGQSRRSLSLRRAGMNRGVFEATLEKPLEGNYHVWLAEPILAGEPATDFQVLPAKAESSRLQTDVEQLRRAADDTKGRYYTFATAVGLPGDLTMPRQVPIERLPPVTLWDKWPLLAILLLLLVTEWLLRKRCGMV